MSGSSVSDVLEESIGAAGCLESAGTALVSWV